MSELPGFVKIPPEPLSKKEVTTVLESCVAYYTDYTLDMYRCILYPYDVSIILSLEPDSSCYYYIFLFEKDYYSILDLTIPFYFEEKSSIITGIELDSKLTKEIYIDKLILDIANFEYDMGHLFMIPTNVHIKILEITSPLSLFRENTRLLEIRPDEIIIPSCEIADICSRIFNEEKDSVEIFLDFDTRIPVSIKNPRFGKTHYFRYDGMYRILDPYYSPEAFKINPSEPNILLVYKLGGLYLEDDFVVRNSNGDQISINSIFLNDSSNISLPNFITKLESQSEIYGYLDISRCVGFQLESLLLVGYHYSTIYVNINQFNEMRASNLIVQRQGEEFYVLSSYADQMERENYVKVVIKNE